MGDEPARRENRRERRVGDGRRGGVARPNDLDLVRHTDSQLVQRHQRSDRHIVGGADERVRAVALVPEQSHNVVIPALRGIVAERGPTRFGHQVHDPR